MNSPTPIDSATRSGTVAVRKRGWLRRLFAFIGPAYLVSVGYMDPGNWATDIEGGARFGYALIWVLLMSNLMAVLLQALAARLGIVTGYDLAQGCRRDDQVETRPPIEPLGNRQLAGRHFRSFIDLQLVQQLGFDFVGLFF